MKQKGIKNSLYKFILDPTVRDNSAEAIGVAMKVVGEKAISPFISELDNLKMAKVSSCLNFSQCHKIL